MSFIADNWSLLTAAAAAAISVLSLLANVALTQRGHRIKAEQLAIDMDSHLLDWAEDVLEAMGRAGQVLIDGAALADAGRARSDVLRDLSVLLDRGRWYAPNVPDPRHGADKPAAYRGHRQPVLDCIYAIYDLVKKGGGTTGSLDDRLVEIRRTFVSEVQTLTDPRRRREFLRRAATKKSI